MRRRTLTAMLLVAGLAVLGFGVPLALAAQAFYRDEALLELFGDASQGAVAVPASYVQDNDVPELPSPPEGGQLGLYTAEGRLLTGTGPATADNQVNAVLSGATVVRDRDQLVVVVPVSQNESVVGAVRASLPQSAVSARTQRAWAVLASLAGAVLLGCAVFATSWSRRLSRPLSALSDDAALIGAGGEIAPRPPSGVDEIDAVQRTMVDASFRLNESMARERSFSTDLAHQMRTPLASLRIRLEAEQIDPTGDSVRLVEECLDDVDRLQQTIDDVMDLARDTRVRRGRLQLTAVLSEAQRHWTPRSEAVGRQLVVRSEQPLPHVLGSESAVRQILDVLLDNSITHGRGTTVVSAAAVGRGVVLSVHDEGTRTLDPATVFTRRHPGARGSGIGLALARRLAEAEGMHLSLAQAGPGPTFRLTIGGEPAL